MPYAVSYARFSSAKQENGSSLERQNEKIADWLKNHPQYTFYKNFQDLGRSAYKGVHLDHGFGELLTEIDSGKIKNGDVLLVEAIDRIGRLPEMKMFALMNRIIEAGVKIITLIDGLEYGPNIKSDQIWLLTGKVQQAHNYSQNLGDRISASYKAREVIAASGKIPKRRTPIWLSSDGKLKTNIATAIKGAFEDALTGMGERRILRRLISADPVFSKINPATIRKWLTNKTAIGYWRDHRIYPPVVTDELFYQVQKRFKDSYKPATAPTKNYLSGLVKCGNCGANMQVKAHKHSPHTMSCSNRSKYGKEKCENGRTVPIPVLVHICNDTATSAVDQALIKIQLSDSQRKLIVVDGKLNEISKRIENLGVAIQVAGFTPELQKQLELLISEKDQLENQKNIINRTEPEDGSRYELAWDRQYELLDNDPMRLNALLQTAKYTLTCFSDGHIKSSTTGNEFSECQYTGYDRKLQTYLVKSKNTIYRIENKQGTLAKGRVSKLIEVLEKQRQNRQQATITY